MKSITAIALSLLAASISSVHAETATIKTSQGDIVCQLFNQQAPNTVANFVGLATGTKEFVDPSTNKMTKRPFYNGLTFHRIIPGFMIQGGDPLGTGFGGPGYRFDNENTNASFNEAGVLAMANAGPNKNGSQFFITVAPRPDLQGSYNVFGQVISGQAVADKISELPRDGSDKPITPVIIESITIQK